MRVTHKGIFLTIDGHAAVMAQNDIFIDESIEVITFVRTIYLPIFFSLKGNKTSILIGIALILIDFCIPFLYRAIHSD